MLTLVRHGRTAANAAGVLQGRVDNPLDEVGEAQALAVGRSIGTESIDHVVCSPLLRARQTAQAITDRSGVDMVLDDRFVELDYGVYDSIPLSDLPADVWAQWIDDPGFTPPGGESLLDLRRRVWSALEDLTQVAVDSHVVVVCHTSPIKAAVQWALGADAELSWRMRLDTAAVCRVGFRGSRPVLTSFNDIGHLADVNPQG
ncbi:MAG: histidine phosphatase family protein [Actinomycetia bacterium]|nr:histidine phosphatase family protein [Actinomycetes bacterium]MCP4958659.1 histidine phosphatase family protein [Actinomycetes bacterium]